MKNLHTFEEFLNEQEEMLNEEILSENTRFLNFRYAIEMDKIRIDSIENYRDDQKTDAEFEKAAKHFGRLPGAIVFTAKDPKDVKDITLLAKKHSIFGIWTVNNGTDVFITRAS